MRSKKFILRFEEVGIKDVFLVGGKNASLGEMIQNLGPKGIRIPGGFVVTAEAYRLFLRDTGLEQLIRRTLRRLDTRNLKDLSRRARFIRDSIKKSLFPTDLARAICSAYRNLEGRYGNRVDVAVRSSATAEDLPGASFAGEHETYLGIRGERQVLSAVRAAMASLFTDRAISYRVDKGFGHSKVALSVGVQKMVRSDKGAAGVIFTLDTESGFRDVVLINGSFGLGELIVKGEVTPDEFLVWKRGLKKGGGLIPLIDKRLGVKNQKMVYSTSSRGIKQTKIVSTTVRERENFILTDKEVLLLARWAVMIEEHYSRRNRKWTPMDIEWAKDGESGELFIVQARPETIHAERDYSQFKEYRLLEKKEAVVRGASVGSAIAVGRARVILNAKKIGDFQEGEILVTDMTDPNWEPIMKIASAIVTDKGGRTSHAAIVSRELGIPAVVGTEEATTKLKNRESITVDTTKGEGKVYRGKLRFKIIRYDLKKIPKPRTKIMVNIAIPENAFETSFLPNEGVGLAREEFIIASKIGIHPLALLNYSSLSFSVKKRIRERIRGWRDTVEFYVDNLAFGIAKIGAAFYPRPVIVRFSDFKTNEYRALLGGEFFEPREENPMIGWRGASRYYDPKFRDAFKLECRAIKRVREKIGLTNVIPMVPFCRTPREGMQTLEIMAQSGLVAGSLARKKRAKRGRRTPVYVMCEIPSNVVLADAFLDIFDGMSIGSNDLTQLVLGIDRDSTALNHVANENDMAVRKLISDVIQICKARKKYIGICGQAPSDYPEFAEFLVKEGIESISLNPDTVVRTTIAISRTEARLMKKKPNNS